MATAEELTYQLESLRQQVITMQTQLAELQSQKPLQEEKKAVPVNRRHWLKRLALASMAGTLAAGTASSFSTKEAQAGFLPAPNIGAYVAPPGAVRSSGALMAGTYGLFATNVTSSVNLSTLTNGVNGGGLYAYSENGQGVIAISVNGSGLNSFGTGPNSYGATFLGGYCALDIAGGRLIIEHAGIWNPAGSTPVPSAFIHKTVAGAGGNVSGNYSIIDHPFANNRPDALLMVTHNFNPPGQVGVYVQSPAGVYYSGGRWRIYLEDTTQSMPDGVYFNVLVILPN